MRFHLRFPGDYWVDRPDLEAQQCVEATGTNTPINTIHTLITGVNTAKKAQKHVACVHCAVTDTTHQHRHEAEVGQHNCITLNR